MKSDGNAHVHEFFVIVLVYAGDLVAFGKPDKVKQAFHELGKRFLLNEAGTLNNDGDKACFLGINLERSGDTMFVFEDKE